MLLELNIRHFIIIDQINVKFDRHLNVLTGETGAGKSILIQAINLALGQKLKNGASKIRGDKATIELVFDADPEQFTDLVVEGIDFTQGLFVVSRDIYANGKSVSRLNGQVISQTQLRPLTERLIDVHGQHMHQSLLDPKTHLTTLDQFGQEALSDLMASVAARADDHAALVAKREALALSEQERDVDYLTFQLNEIDGAAIDLQNDLLIEEEFERFEHMEDYLLSMNATGEALETAGNLLSEARRQLSKADAMDTMVPELMERLESVRIETEDLRSTVTDRIESQDFDPQRYTVLEKRLNQLNLLLKKFGPSLEDVLQYRDTLAERIERHADRDRLLSELDASIDEAYRRYEEAAIALSERRQAVAKQFAKAVVGEARVLNLPDLKLVTDLTPLRDGQGYRVSRKGFDKAAFRITTNPGLSPMPLTEVASGGEISRIMLGIKAALSRSDMIDTMIFDEIDTGISGETAFQVGLKMRRLSREKQLIVITHLPQIAAAADRHFRIEKLEGQSTLTPLTEHQQVEEIARIVSGESIDASALDNSRQLIRQARKAE